MLRFESIEWKVRVETHYNAKRKRWHQKYSGGILSKDQITEDYRPESDHAESVSVYRVKHSS